MTSMLISRFTAKSAPPTREVVSWQELAVLFADPRRTSCTALTCQGSTCPHKDGECWSPAVFSSDKRSKQYVESVSCLALDIDHVTDTVVETMRTQLVDYQHLLHATHADRPDDRCLRVLVQLSRAVTLLEWPRFWEAAIGVLSAPVDPVCGDVARCWYLPSRPRDTDYFVAVHTGKALDVDATLASVPGVRDPVAQIIAQEGVAP